jgi:tetratricopeptide (TPR) repeat protein
MAVVGCDAGRSDERVKVLKELADALMADYAVSYARDTVEEAIVTYEEILQLRPFGHERRDEAVSDLGDALFSFCHFNGTHDTRASRCLDLHREAVQLRPSNHPHRARSLHHLAMALLFIDYEQGSGNLAALEESIQLNREALQLRIVGHPERGHSLANLAAALMRAFEHCGDPTLIMECIAMNREALQLALPGNPRRQFSLNNLAVALYQLAGVQGGLEALAEADSLLREVLELRPPGHPLRSRALDNLATSLGVRYELQALPAALSEAVALRREAWELSPASHPEWGRRTENLAGTLIDDFRHRRDTSSITEAITLLRRALVLRPLESSFRHHSLQHLADALLLQFDEYGDPAYLQEAIALYREVLNLRPPGHTLRPGALHRLGLSLTRSEHQSWPEALALFCDAADICPAGHPLRSSLLSDMSKCFLDLASPFFDVAKGVSLLSEEYSNELSHVNQRLGQAVSDLQAVNAAYTESARGADALGKAQASIRILELHIQVLGLLPRAANLGLDHKTRLQVISGSDEIARNAAAHALLLGRESQAVELLEEGRGIFWSQTLRLRTTTFDGVPDADRESLMRLLRMLGHGARTVEGFDQTVAQREEALERRRRLNEEAEALITRIRAYPGCTRFLMPARFDVLIKGLPDGYVVILNASRLGCHALLLHKATGAVTSLEMNLPSTQFDGAALRTRLPRDVSSQAEQYDELRTRAMRLDSGNVSSFEVVLSQLWTSIVHPVIFKLGLQVSDELAARLQSLTAIYRRQPDMIDHGSGGVLQGSSASSQFMPLVSIKVSTLRAHRTMQFPLTLLRCRPSYTFERAGSPYPALQSPVCSYARRTQITDQSDIFLEPKKRPVLFVTASRWRTHVF